MIYDKSWEKKWAEMSAEERAATGVIIEEHIMKHGKCYTVRGRDDIMITIREDGFIAGNIQIENHKPMTCENFVRLLAEFARAARYFEWTEEDKEKGRNPQTSLMGAFMGWGTVPVSTFAELPPPEVKDETICTRHSEEGSGKRAGGGSLPERPIQALPETISGTSKGLPEL